MNPREYKCLGRSDCRRCEHRSQTIFAEIGLEDIDAFQAPIDRLVYEPGAVLYHDGHVAQAIQFMRYGAVKLVRFDAAGHQRIVRILKQGDVAGLEAILSEKHQHTAIAITEVHTCRVPMQHFQSFLLQAPRLQMRLMEKFHQALQEVDQWLSELVSNTIPARTRLARLLLRLRIGNSGDIHRLSLADTGAILGLTPETLCRIQRELVNEGVLLKAGKGRAHRRYQGDIAALSMISQNP